MVRVMEEVRGAVSSRNSRPRRDKDRDRETSPNIRRPVRLRISSSKSSRSSHHRKRQQLRWNSSRKHFLDVRKIILIDWIAPALKYPATATVQRLYSSSPIQVNRAMVIWFRPHCTN